MFDIRLVKRVRSVVSVLAKHELHHVISALNLTRYVPFFKRSSSRVITTQPETLKKVCEELGGGFLKLGQLIALRPDLVGAKFSKAFESLFDDVPAQDFDLIKPLISHIPLRNISKKPIGSGSIAQVYKATLCGRSVAVKVKRPGINDIFSKDIMLLEYFAQLLDRKKVFPFFDVLTLVAEFKEYTHRELDLSHEAANMRRFAKNLKGFSHVRIPKVIDEYSTADVLVMEFIKGVPIDKITMHKTFVSNTFVGVIYKMLFEDRFFHADLHPGNIFVDGKTITFLDCGIAGHIDSAFEKKLFALFASLVNGDLDALANSLLDLDIGDGEPDEQLLKDGLFNVLADYYDKSLDSMPFDKIFYGAIDVARNSHIKLPANMVLFGKSIVSLDGTCRKLNPKFNVVKNAKPYVKKLLVKRFSPKRILSDSKQVLASFAELFQSFPSGIKSFSRKFAKIEERIIDIDRTFHVLNRTVSNSIKLLSVTLLFATFFISSILLMKTPPLLAGFSIFFYAGMLASLLFFIAVIDLLFRN